MRRPEPRRAFRVIEGGPPPQRSGLRSRYHRFGIAAASTIGGLGAAVGVSKGLFGPRAGPADWMIVPIVTALCAASAYGACRALGWAVSKFQGR
ncbi:hypothetical protein GOFOIKOB_4673 [Methylobacterium tardum]|uniref:Uncharacterized protein n=1 Tax=Methylobacterium tardum TaxID=374432 RepID=A0AA37TGY9_9HYPH|nr:hypothetical protein [Methylobacterium tardum]URD37573.1 hypothetical protein M6G65_03140 [Methylobacterium tardum]GJE51612.1 hypothetical protein GOFOIKOB_4673 [Methylobacterium tardum]GLS70519.1 hypothetical protein GCM10007890_25320 [Methylobacterium tardum]